jgi:hypothetical protein
MNARHCLAVILVLLVPGAAAAQTVFKCMDGRSVTYSNTPCEKLGLKTVGEVADRVTTLPAIRPAPAAAKAPSAAAPGNVVSGNEVDVPKASAIRPVNPLMEKLAK